MTSAPEEKYHHKPWDIDPITIRMLKHAGLSPCDLPAPEEDGGDVHAIHYLHQGRIPLIYGKKPHDIEFAAERRERGKDEIVIWLDGEDGKPLGVITKKINKKTKGTKRIRQGKKKE